MTVRKFVILSFFGFVNTAVFLWCHFWLVTTVTSGPEGIGVALLEIGVVCFGCLLSAFTLNIFYGELARRKFTWQSITATLLSIAPLVLFVIFEVAPYRNRR